MRFPAQAVNPPGLVSDPQWDTVNGGWLFDAGKTEMIQLIGQMPHGWRAGTAIHPHVHWEKTVAGAGNVRWLFDFWHCQHGQARVAKPGSVNDLPVLATDDADTQMITAFEWVLTPGWRASDILVMEVSRLGGDALDTYGSDARLLEFDIHIILNALGSVRELPG